MLTKPVNRKDNVTNLHYEELPMDAELPYALSSPSPFTPNLMPDLPLPPTPAGDTNAS